MSHNVERIRQTGIVLWQKDAYIHAGNECTSANDIKKGILHQGGPKNAKVTVTEIDKSRCNISYRKIPNIQSFHSVSFNNNGLNFWQYYNCGTGKFFLYQSLEFTSGLNVTSEITTVALQQADSFLTSKKRMDRTLCNIFFCPQLGCTNSFTNQDELNHHILSNNDHFHDPGITSMDSVKVHYAKLLHPSSHTITNQQLPSSSTTQSTIECNVHNQLNKFGWELPAKRTKNRFTYK